MEAQMAMTWGAVSGDLETGFLRFHEDNPEVYERLVEMTRQLSDRGRKRVGMGMLFEVLRWEYFMETDTIEPFKLNNNYRAFYTRMIEQRNPDLRGILTKRKSEADLAVH
jgi:hypothetical protein